MKERLKTALGAVREGAQAVDNLAHLLRSRRVGPRAITVALGEVRESCLELGAALSTLEGELCTKLSGAPDAEGLARRLLAQGAACARKVASQLDVEGPSNARRRLALEDLARRSAGKLEAVIFLAELLVAAASFQAVPLDIHDALLELSGPPARGSAAKGGGARVRASVSLVGGRSFAGDARVVAGLLLLAVGRVAREGFTNPSIAVTGSPGGGVEVRVSGETDLEGRGDPGVDRLELEIPLEEEIPLGGDVLREAAALAGVAVAVREAPLRIALVFSEAGGAGS